MQQNVVVTQREVVVIVLSYVLTPIVVQRGQELREPPLVLSKRDQPVPIGVYPVVKPPEKNILHTVNVSEPKCLPDECNELLPGKVSFGPEMPKYRPVEYVYDKHPDKLVECQLSFPCREYPPKNYLYL